MHCNALQCTALHCTAQRCTAQRCTAQRCAALRSLHCAATCCIVIQQHELPARRLSMAAEPKPIGVCSVRPCRAAHLCSNATSRRRLRTPRPRRVPCPPQAAPMLNAACDSRRAAPSHGCRLAACGHTTSVAERAATARPQLQGPYQIPQWSVLRAIYGVRRTRRSIQRTLHGCACATGDEDGGQCHRRKVPAMQQH